MDFGYSLKAAVCTNEGGGVLLAFMKRQGTQVSFPPLVGLKWPLRVTERAASRGREHAGMND